MHELIETIESGYEYLLAFAAQGRESDDGSEARATLDKMSLATKSIRDEMQDSAGEFDGVVADDARKAGAAIALVLAQEKISSELVDNLNASIHLRALLTDLFLLSESSP